MHVCLNTVFHDMLNISRELEADSNDQEPILPTLVQTNNNDFWKIGN